MAYQMNSSAHGGGISLGIRESSSKNPLTPNTMVSNIVSTCREIKVIWQLRKDNPRTYYIN